MNYSGIHNYDVANGPGVRVSLFVSGCPHHCHNCFNQETWDYKFGDIFDESIKNTLFEMLDKKEIRGFTLLGGEPMSPPNQEECAKLLEEIKLRFPEKDIWCYTGYVYETEILKMKANSKHLSKMLENIDVLVDGPFVESLKNPSLQFRGSENQNIIQLKKSH